MSEALDKRLSRRNAWTDKLFARYKRRIMLQNIACVLQLRVELGVLFTAAVSEIHSE